MKLSSTQEKFHPYEDNWNQKASFFLNREIKLDFAENRKIKHAQVTWDFLYDLAHYDPEYKVRISIWDLVNRMPGNYSKSTIIRHLNILEEHGWLLKIRTWSKNGTTTNIYKVGTPENLVTKINVQKDRQFKVVPIVDYSIEEYATPSSESTPPTREGAPIDADNIIYQPLPSKTSSIQGSVIEAAANISIINIITNCPPQESILSPIVTYAEVIQEVRSELVKGFLEKEKGREGEGEEKDPREDARAYITQFCEAHHLEGTPHQIVATLQNFLTQQEQSEKEAISAFNNAPSHEKFKKLKEMQDASAFTYQTKTQVEHFKTMVEQLEAPILKSPPDDGSIAPQLCFNEENFDALYKKIVKLRIKGVDIKKLLIEVVWSICFGSLRISTRTGQEHTPNEAINVAMWLICTGKWKMPKGMMHNQENLVK